MSAFQRFFAEARRRRVFRTIALYIVAAWVLIQVADQLFQAWGIPDTALRYIWIGLAIGFPLAVVFGWKYDITANGVVRTPPADPESVADVTLRRADYLILTALVVVAGAVVWGVAQRAGDVPREAQPDNMVAADNSIVVLPFRNVSDEAGTDYLSEGLTTELSGNLARIPRLRVTANRSAFAVAALGLGIKEIGERLAVRFVLDGTVRKFEDKLRIGIELVDARDGSRLWRQEFDREMGDMFVLQSEIAGSVLSALQVPLDIAQGEAIVTELTSNPKAYELYLLGLHEFREMRDEEKFGDWIDRAMRYYEQAIEADPDFVSAYVKLATAHLTLLWTARSDQYEQSMATGQELLEKAIELDPQLDTIYSTLARFHRNNGDQAAEIEVLKKALQLNPANIDAISTLGKIYWIMGRPDDARDLIRSAAARDPLNNSSIILNADFDANLGNYEQAKSQLLRLIAENPDGQAVSALSKLEQSYGHLDENIRWLYQINQQDPENVMVFSMLARAATNLGAYEIAGQWLAKAEGSNHPFQMSSQLSFMVVTGRAPEAAAHMNQMIALANIEDGARLEPGQAYALQFAAFVNSVAGKYEESLSHFQRQETMERFNIPIQAKVFLYASMSRMSQELDRPDDADRYLALTEAEIDKFAKIGEIEFPGQTIAKAIWYAVRGEQDQALVLIEESIDQGFRESPLLLMTVPFKDYQEIPEFQALIARIDADVTLQRERAIKNGWLVSPSQD